MIMVLVSIYTDYGKPDTVKTVTGWGDGWGPTHQLHLESHTHIGCGFLAFLLTNERKKWPKIKDFVAQL